MKDSLIFVFLCGLMSHMEKDCSNVAEVMIGEWMFGLHLIEDIIKTKKRKMCLSRKNASLFQNLNRLLLLLWSGRILKMQVVGLVMKTPHVR